MSALVIDNQKPLVQSMLELLYMENFSDLKIEGKDGSSIAANKAVLSVTSKFFRAMFSNNFVESRAATIQLPFTKEVLEKLVTYLYSNQLTCEDMSLHSLIELMVLFDYVNLPNECSSVESFTREKVARLEFSLADCEHAQALANCPDSITETFRAIVTILRRLDCLGLTVDDARSRAELIIREGNENHHSLRNCHDWMIAEVLISANLINEITEIWISDLDEEMTSDVSFSVVLGVVTRAVYINHYNLSSFQTKTLFSSMSRLTDGIHFISSVTLDAAAATEALRKIKRRVTAETIRFDDHDTTRHYPEAMKQWAALLRWAYRGHYIAKID